MIYGDGQASQRIVQLLEFSVLEHEKSCDGAKTDLHPFFFTCLS